MLTECSSFSFRESSSSIAASGLEYHSPIQTFKTQRGGILMPFEQKIVEIVRNNYSSIRHSGYVGGLLHDSVIGIFFKKKRRDDIAPSISGVVHSVVYSECDNVYIIQSTAYTNNTLIGTCPLASCCNDCKKLQNYVRVIKSRESTRLLKILQSSSMRPSMNLSGR